ncbi:MAG: prolyl oligopeptidase family serine peptidase, partial [Bacteroidota bacterium]
FLVGSFSLFAQENQRWKVADVVNQESVSGAVFSLDHQKVAWLKRRPSKKKDGFVTDLWVTYLDKQGEDGKPKSVRLSRSDTHSDRNPIFSADGETIYYLSSKGGGKVLYAMSLWGGAPYAVDSFKTSISRLARWNDSTLLFVAQEGQTLYEAELKKKKDNVQVIEDTAHFKATRLFAYDLKQKKRRRLTDNRFPIGSYAYSSDGRWLVTSYVRSPHYGADAQPPMVYELWDLAEGSNRPILQGLQTPGNFQFTRDNRGFYFTATESSDPEWTGSGVQRLHYFDLKQRNHQKVELNWDWGIGGGYQVRGNDALVSLANGTTNRWAMYRRQDGTWGNLRVNTGELKEHFSLVALAENGEVALVNHSTASQPPRYVRVEIGEGKGLVTLEEKGEWVKLNAHLDKKTKARTESITWKGALGDRVTGMLYYPHGYEAGKTYKLMVAIHGGPSGVDRDRWSDRWAYFHNLLAQEGCFVFKPNYHGSSNHGLAFVESIKGHYYEYELPDIISGIDSLAEAGLISKDSMAVMGWSNGAILTTMLTVEHPNLFLAATPGAGDVNWTSDFGTCGFGVQFDQSYFG